MANELTDISLLFEEIIDTPAKRRKEVEAAGIRAQERFRQANRPFSLLAGGIASGIPRQTENIRNTMKGFGFDTRTGGERLSDKIKGVDLTQPGSQAEILRMIREVDPGKAAALEDMYAQRETDKSVRDAQLANRFQVNNRIFQNGVIFNQTARGDMSLVIPATDERPPVTLTDPAAIAREYAIAESLEAKSEVDQLAAVERARQASIAMQARATDAIDQANQLRTQLGLYDDALTQIREEGASPGWKNRWTPRFMQDPASLRFEQIANQLGLQVISGTTFGALSERELALAMRTGMPELNETQDYVVYLNDKKEATEKLMREMILYANWLRSEGYDIAFDEAQEAFSNTRSHLREDEEIDLSSSAGVASLPIANTQAEIDALESGTVYTWDGAGPTETATKD